jgi:hypothetical protein
MDYIPKIDSYSRKLTEAKNGNDKNVYERLHGRAKTAKAQ